MVFRPSFRVKRYSHGGFPNAVLPPVLKPDPGLDSRVCYRGFAVATCADCLNLTEGADGNLLAACNSRLL